MSKTRDAIPRPVREALMKEFNHRCAVCADDRPQVHHIDENPSNNDRLNLVPLCPSCHLSDQHDASNAIPKAKLQFFRRHKHRLILTPQFNAVLRRMSFLESLSDTDDPALAGRAAELVSLVRNLSMGAFYGGEIEKLVKPPSYAYVVPLGVDPATSAVLQAQRVRERAEYREQLRTAAPRVEALVVELLDYQAWPLPKETHRR